MKDIIIQFILRHKILTTNVIAILLSLFFTTCSRPAAHKTFLNPFGIKNNTMDGYLVFFGFTDPTEYTHKGPFGYPPVRIGSDSCYDVMSSYFYIFSDILALIIVLLLLKMLYQRFFPKP